MTAHAGTIGIVYLVLAIVLAWKQVGHTNIISNTNMRPIPLIAQLNVQQIQGWWL